MYRLESYLAEAGYRVILSQKDDHPEQGKGYLEMLFSNQVDGHYQRRSPDALVNIPHAQAPPW